MLTPRDRNLALHDSDESLDSSGDEGTGDLSGGSLELPVKTHQSPSYPDDGPKENGRTSSTDSGGDDLVRIYLKQAAEAPLLSQAQEQSLAKLKNNCQKLLRLRAYSIDYVADRCLDILERLQAGTLRVDNSIEVSVNDTAACHAIRKLLTSHVPTIRNLVVQNRKDIQEVFSRATNPERQSELRTAIGRRRLKIALLLSELRIRDSKLDRILKQLRATQARAAKVRDELKVADAPGLRRECKRHLINCVLTMGGTPETIGKRIERLDQIAATSKKVKDMLVNSNLRLVVSIAKNYQNRRVPFLDLIQEGNSGLMRAVDKFDGSLNFKLCTYATWWIRRSITRALVDTSRTIRLPGHIDGLVKVMVETESRLVQELHREPTTREMYDRMNPERKFEAGDYDLFRRVWALKSGVCSLDSPVDSDGEATFADFVPTTSDSDEDSFARILLADKAEQLYGLLEDLRASGEDGPRLVLVLTLLFGIGEGREQTLQAVGEQLGLTKQRIKQLRDKAVKRLTEISGRKSYEHERLRQRLRSSKRSIE